METIPRVAVWVIGPVGSGKSALIARALPAGFRLVDQDALLERRLAALRIPLDARAHDPAQVAAFAAARKRVSDRLWRRVPAWRAAGLPLAFETTGDKPPLLRREVEANRAAGYTNLAVGLRATLDECLRRNRERARVLPNAVVEQTWHDFDRHLDAGLYEEIIGRGAFALVTDPREFDLAAWLRTALPVPCPD